MVRAKKKSIFASGAIYTAKVAHKRLLPKQNSFCYAVYYLALPLPAAPIPGRLIRFQEADLGTRDGSDPTSWIRKILQEYGLNEQTEQIILLTMPCVLGYVFNPVSFYFCLDTNGALKAVLCEVHNTFGEQHSYLCAHEDHKTITADHVLEAQKVFHVSPFLERNGKYEFRFDLRQEELSIWIDYYDAAEQKKLMTSLTGTFAPLTDRNLRRAFWSHPLVALKAIALIHWQALRLLAKGIRYIPKPTQHKANITATRNLNKM